MINLGNTLQEKIYMKIKIIQIFRAKPQIIRTLLLICDILQHLNEVYLL